MKLEQIHSAYFVGIGGIGMSALARWFHSRDITVSGYDRVQTPLTKKLSEEGINIHYEDDVDQIPQGVVEWDVEVTNQNGETVATETVLTLLKRKDET